mmetsp:Transcript_126138/g.200047  ORF Transcript_126138/g.200047 Transcript_126138/m.200047 type:complete len:197 (+) Transcript_126138:540-1130(+)
MFRDGVPENALELFGHRQVIGLMDSATEVTRPMPDSQADITETVQSVMEVPQTQVMDKAADTMASSLPPLTVPGGLAISSGSDGATEVQPSGGVHEHALQESDEDVGPCRKKKGRKRVAALWRRASWNDYRVGLRVLVSSRRPPADLKFGEQTSRYDYRKVTSQHQLTGHWGIDRLYGNTGFSWFDIDQGSVWILE